MSTFSSLFQSGTAFYGDPFGPAIDVLQDWAWSILPGPYSPRSGGGHVGASVPAPQPAQSGDARFPGVPVEEQWGIEAETTYVPEVLSRRAGSGTSAVPRTTVVVEGLPTEVEEYEIGDFPAGSIFAPGRTWGGGIELLDRAEPPEDEYVAGLGDILDWGIDTVLGKQEWQIGNIFDPVGYQAGMNRAVPSLPAPSGIPGQPTTVYGYTGGTAVTSGGDCGNRRYVTLDRETGKISCRRRRRRRLLTNRDLADLASLKTVVGGGAALNAAVIRAVR